MTTSDDASKRGAPGRAPAPPLPRCLQEVDARWLTEVLAAAPGSRVVGVDVTDVGTGRGLLGQIHRFELRWSGAAGPASVVVKLPAAGARSRALAEDLGMYTREVGFYRDLAHLHEVAIGCRHADIDPATHDFVLVLEDLSGAATVDQLAGCPADRAAQVVSALAGMQAVHWDEAGLAGASEQVPLARSTLAEALADAFEGCWPDVRGGFGDELPRSALGIGDGLAAALPRLAEILSRPPRTLSHGDLRLDNVFFDQRGAVRLCDWQLSGRSRGARDLAYFLTQSLDPDVRRATEDDLVELYVSALEGHGVSGYDASTVRQDYRVSTVLGFAYAVIALGALDQDDPRSAAIPRAMLQRSAAAMDDAGCQLPE